MTDAHPREPLFSILFVCTGNICRSALAERLGRAYLDDVLGEEGGSIALMSAGTRAAIDSAMHPDTALVLAGFGGTPGNFRARQLLPAHTERADLVLAMARGHRREALRLFPRGLTKTFTLREAADLLVRVGDGLDCADDDFARRARRLVALMAAARSNRPVDPDDDVPDPINQPVEAHQHVGELITGALLPLLRRIAELHAEAAVTDVPPGTVGR